ncbi:MAG TPA: serine/threonine-protein kinase, partial [Polyangiaceae bacterium LLY-WYZ-15_(1-7)]|nr:serine/threonine-protein kinase [Polyangiaceae bacterium LLY-WYZ-15_(1-7)]
MDSLVGRILGETYEVERRLGVGGFGAVYAAKHVRTGRRYAVKVLRPDRAMVSPGARERFRREAEALAKLGHAGIVRVHDYASEGGIDFLVMDLLEGEDLAQHLHRGGALPQDRAVAIFGGIADALEAAHAADTIHRDLKPGNVFLARVPGEPERPVLLDFGLAKH